MKGQLPGKRASHSFLTIFASIGLGLWLIVMNFSAEAQVSVQGKVIDSNNSTGLPGVNILVNDSTVHTTDLKGNFHFHVHSYPVTLQVTYVGYEKKVITLRKPGMVTIELKAAQFMLGEVVVTAYESRQQIKDIPGSISLVTPKDLTVDNDVNLVPALNKVPGIFMQEGSYNTNRLTIRGIGSRELFGTSKIRAYYDNIPLTTGDGSTTIEDIDPILIDRIEIIKGPSSSLYGAGLGGTVLISSFQPSLDQKRIRYQVTGGSYGYIKNALTAEAGFNKTRFAAGFDKVHSNGYRENNRFDRTTAGFSSKTSIGKNSSLAFLFNYVGLYGQIPSSLDKKTYDTNPRSAASSWLATRGYENYDKSLTGLSFTQGLGKSSTLDASVFGSYFSSYERRPFNILAELTRAWGSRIKLTHEGNLFGNHLETVLGYEYYEDRYFWKTIQNLNNQEGVLLSNNKEGRRNMNVFLKADYILPTKTIISAGLNLNFTDYHFKDIYSIDSVDNSGSYTFGQTLSPRIGISQPVSREFNLYASISHGFSPPSLSETLTPAGKINPDIKPETGINYETGARGFLLHSKMYIDLALFSLQVRNLLVAQRIGADEFVGVNAGKTSHKGVELTANYKISGNRSGTVPNLVAFLTYNYSDFKFLDYVDNNISYSGNRLTGVPESELNAGLDFSMKQGFYGNLSFQAIGVIPANDSNTVFTEAYHLVNFKAGFRHSLPAHLSMDLYGIINNLFDEKYASMVQVNATPAPNGPRYFYPGLPRNFYIGLILNYDF